MFALAQDSTNTWIVILLAVIALVMLLSFLLGLRPRP
jgi:hypothetical protein